MRKYYLNSFNKASSYNVVANFENQSFLEDSLTSFTKDSGLLKTLQTMGEELNLDKKISSKQLIAQMLFFTYPKNVN